MRTAFVETLVELAEHDRSIVLLTGDLGYTVLEPFADRFPDRFFNVGVAEQNMLAVATGLAASGFTPYAYSIATFASLRPYEFWRNGPILHQLPVRLVGVGAGVDYGHNGVTHFALEDIAVMRVQPDLTIVAPADSPQAAAAVRATAALPGPVYLRLGKDGPPLAPLGGRFRLGHLELIGTGADVAVITHGAIAGEALAAAGQLEEQGVGVTVAVAASIAPAPVDDLRDLLGTVRAAVTLESHYATGGLGSLVSEVAAAHALPCPVIRLGLTSMPRGTTGSARYLMDRHGLSAGAVVDAARSALGRTAAGAVSAGSRPFAT